MNKSNAYSKIVKYLKSRKLPAKITFILIGSVSTIWFLIRVIPKPSRAAYPCMQAAAPFASAFVLYILGLIASIALFRKGKKLFSKSRYIAGIAFFLIAVLIGGISTLSPTEKAMALTASEDNIANMPIGEGKGVIPGRVVWGHNPNATNENYSPKPNYWFDDENTNRQVVEKLVSDVLQELTMTSSDEEAWDEIFKYHNSNPGKGNLGYSIGEKIVIKVNLNSNRSKYGSGDYGRSKKENIDTSPQIILAVLNQLVNKAGVAQEDISIGDPGRNYDDVYFAKCTQEFPDVNYWGEGNGRTPHTTTEEKVLFASDGGIEDWLPQCYVDAAYMINIPVFKKHHRAGISLSSKNHFGTFVTSSRNAAHWHYSLPVGDGKAVLTNPGYGLYRCFVDIMGHKDMGDKTILYLFDALWSSTNNANPPIKWRMEPFNNDYPSSIFASIDPVAIESVGYDFLFEEFGPDHPTEGAYDPQDNKGPFPRYSGVDDFLHQAADSSNWPEGIIYDPENDGTPLPGSLGVHEHWNNARDKQYSRNLGSDIGIELLYVNNMKVGTGNMDIKENLCMLKQNYPNPFRNSTCIEFSISERSPVRLSIHDMSGRTIKVFSNREYQPGTYSAIWEGKSSSGKAVTPGIYFYKLQVGDSFETKKMNYIQ